MRITLNGEPLEIEGARTVATLLADLEVDARLVAVEVNRVVIKRDQFASTPVPDGAEVEIVAFVGGGSPLVGRRRDALQ
jgi:thiamine biosynthesis protein ThiS